MTISPDWDARFMRLAKEVSTWSKDPSTQCGAVITDNHKRIVSVGYNGFPRWMEDRLEHYEDREIKYDRIIHSEVNSILNATRPLDGCAMYVWPFPTCHRCALQIIQSGILLVVSPPLPEDMKDRWGESINKALSYYEEAGISYEFLDN